MASDTENEICRPVPGWESSYEVSSHGRVRSCGSWVRNRGDTHSFRKGRVLTLIIKKGSGRVQVTLARGEQRVTAQVAVLVAYAFLGPRPKDKHVAHSNDDPADNRLTNLYYATPKENYRDSRSKRLARWKLTDADVRRIRAAKGKVCVAFLVEQFGVSDAYVRQIQSGRCRK